VIGPVTPGADVADEEYVCEECRLVHWSATPPEVACDRHPAHYAVA